MLEIQEKEVEKVILPINKTERILPNSKKYIALKTIKVNCNGVFQLTQGQEIPEGINKTFIESLKNSKIIK